MLQVAMGSMSEVDCMHFFVNVLNTLTIDASIHVHSMIHMHFLMTLLYQLLSLLYMHVHVSLSLSLSLSYQESSDQGLALSLQNVLTTVGYVIGGHFFSLHDIKHGVLRGNRFPPGELRRCFIPANNDFRLVWGQSS
jgi:hypothetical protein